MFPLFPALGAALVAWAVRELTKAAYERGRADGQWHEPPPAPPPAREPKPRPRPAKKIARSPEPEPEPMNEPEPEPIEEDPYDE